MPCASGEEGYSALITCVKAGWDPKNLKLVGLDLHPELIKRAKEGVYTRHAFRFNDLPTHLKSFIQVDLSNYFVSAKICARAKFHVANILDREFLKKLGTFDIILARNLLIYLTQPARQTVMDSIDELLSNEGLLILGHADNIHNLKTKFKHTGKAENFAYIKKSNGE